MQTGGDVVPRQDLVLGSVPRDVPVGVEPFGGHGVEPSTKVESLAPFLERTAVTPDALDHPPDAPVAAAGDAFDERRRRGVPAQLHTRFADRAPQQADLAFELVDAVLTEPLERRVRLGHESPDRGRAARLLRVLAADADDVSGDL